MSCRFSLKFNNRSQITIVILFGLIITIAVSFIFYANRETIITDGGITDFSLESQSIKFFVESCIKKTLEEGIYHIGLQGGYYNVPEPKINELLFEIPFYFYFGRSNFPKKTSIEIELNKYVENELLECIGDFKVFRSQGYEFETKNLKVVSFLDDISHIGINFPINIKKGDSTAQIENFVYSLQFNFSRIYQIVSEFIIEHGKNPDYSPLGILNELAYNYNFNFEIIDYPNNAVIYTFIFNDTKLGDKPYLFSFASKYNWTDLSSNFSDKEVEIVSIKDQEAYVGYEFLYQVKARGNNIMFYDYSALFDIDGSSGLINFTPTNEQGGKQFIIIKAMDNKGNSDTKIFELIIKDYSQRPYIEKIPDFTINKNQLFNYQVNATDPDNGTIFYSDNTDLFDINPVTGLINFTTREKMKGKHTINISVANINGFSDTEEFELVIK